MTIPSFPRPVPTIGDQTSARDRADQPDGWAFPPGDRDALYSVISARRDVRRFRPDALPRSVLDRLLQAAHNAPSVGHSQPWRFVIVTDQIIREQAAVMADRERLRQAKLLDEQSARQLLDLQLEGIREAPIGIVVCCDRRTEAAGVLGRATFADADMWSCAGAIQNLWLAARAEGLGVGWVTLFEPADLARLIGLPVGVETLGWLCLGWPDERNPTPGLERAGWSRRQDVGELIMYERWEGIGPSVPVSRLRAPEPAAIVAVRDAADVLLTAPSSLGVLDRALTKIVARRGPGVDRGTLLLVSGEHLVADLGVSAYNRSVGIDVLRAAQQGASIGTAMAAAAGLGVKVVNAGTSSGDLVTSDALAPDTVEKLFEEGRRLGGELAEVGLVVLGEVGIGNTTVAAALACVALDLTPAATVGLGTTSNSEMLDRKQAVVAAALERAQASHGAELGSLKTLLSALGGPEFAYLAGAILGAAEAGQMVVLDGFATTVCALLLVKEHPGVVAHLVGGQRSSERAHVLALEALGLEPILDLHLRSGEGVGAVLAAQMLLTALRVRRSTAATEQ